MMLDCIGNYLNFFDLCCFNSGISGITSTQRRIHSIFLIHILLAIFSLCLKFLLFQYFCKIHGFMEAINELVEYSGSLYTYCFIIFDSFVCRHTHKRFWQFIQRLETDAYPVGTFAFRCCKRKLVEFFVASVVVMACKFLASAIVIDFPFYVYCAYLIPVRLCQIRIFYCFLYLEIMRLQLEHIENEMYSPHFVSNEPLQLKRLREIFQNVYATTAMMFGWSQVTVFSCCFFSIFTDLNYAYIHANELKISSKIGTFRYHLKYN